MLYLKNQTMPGLKYKTIQGLCCITVLCLKYKILLGLYWITISPYCKNILGLYCKTILDLNYKTILGLYCTTFLCLKNQTILGLYYKTIQGLHCTTMLWVKYKTILGLYSKTISLYCITISWYYKTIPALNYKIHRPVLLLNDTRPFWATLLWSHIGLHCKIMHSLHYNTLNLTLPGRYLSLVTITLPP